MCVVVQHERIRRDGEILQVSWLPSAPGSLTKLEKNFQLSLVLLKAATVAMVNFKILLEVTELGRR